MWQQPDANIRNDLQISLLFLNHLTRFFMLKTIPDYSVVEASLVKDKLNNYFYGL